MCPWQLKKRPDFSKATRAGPRGPRRNWRVTPSFLPQLEKNHEILHSMRDEALFQSSVSREMPRSLWKHERVLDTLDATQEVPQHTHPHSSGTPSFLADLNLKPFAPPHLEMRVDSPAFSGKESRRSYCPSRGGRSHSETRVEPSWVVPQSQRHLFPHPLEIRPDAPPPIRMETRVSSQNTKGHRHPSCILQKKTQVPNPTRQEA